MLVPSSDPHLSEYLPGRWQGRQHFSGFTGSMATLVVTTDKAALFADSRYWTQAEAELQGSGIALVKIPTGAGRAPPRLAGHRGAPRRRRGRRRRRAGPGRLAGAARTRLAAAGIALKTDADVLADAWDERAELPQARVYEHAAPHAPQPRAAKLAQVRAAMAALGATHHFVSTVDDIAWITNLRGADVDYNPVFLAHLLIARRRAPRCSSAPARSTPRCRPRWPPTASRWPTTPPPAPALAALPRDAVLLVDPRRITLGFREQVADGVRVIESINPSTLAKSRKSADELAFVREAMAQDGAAMCAFYAWFDQATARRPPVRPRHRGHHRREAVRRAPQAPGLRRPELPGHRRLERQRRDAALPRQRPSRTPPSRATACC